MSDPPLGIKLFLEIHWGKHVWNEVANLSELQWLTNMEQTWTSQNLRPQVCSQNLTRSKLFQFTYKQMRIFCPTREGQNCSKSSAPLGNPRNYSRCSAMKSWKVKQGPNKSSRNSTSNLRFSGWQESWRLLNIQSPSRKDLLHDFFPPKHFQDPFSSEHPKLMLYDMSYVY